MRVQIRNAAHRTGTLLSHRVQAGSVRWHVQIDGGSKDTLKESNLIPLELEQSLDQAIESGEAASRDTLMLLLTHARLSGRVADLLYSMRATNTEFFAYQFKPVLNFLRSPSDGILIADEVGLGKTIEAGLIWTELRAREHARRLLVVCPAHLTKKWEDELAKRFGQTADIVNSSELVEKLSRARDDRNASFALIYSMQAGRVAIDKEAEATKSAVLDDVLAESDRNLIDLTVVDEAHYYRNPASKTHRLGLALREASRYLVLLSATPIQTSDDDLFNVIKFLDPGNFSNAHQFKLYLDANRPVISLASSLRRERMSVAKYRELLHECLSVGLLSKNRQLNALAQAKVTQAQLDDPKFVARTADQIERISLFGASISRTKKRDVQENQVKRLAQSIKVHMSPAEQEFYDRVTDIVTAYCGEGGGLEQFLLTIPQMQMVSSMSAAARTWDEKINAPSSVLTDAEDLDPENLVIGSKAKTPGPLSQLLGELVKLGDYSKLRSHDSKFNLLAEQLKQYWRANPSEKVVLFSYYRATVKYLEERLSELGIETVSALGGVDKNEVVERFKSDSGPNLLITTEVLCEGVDLQFASTLINYDVPWNPMKVEQRIGRIDRIGQKKSVIQIWNFVLKDTIHERVFERLTSRLGTFESALGDAEAVIGDEVRSLQASLFRHDLTYDEQMACIEASKKAAETVLQQKEELEKEATSLAAHGDYVLNQAKATEELRRYVTPEQIAQFVEHFIVHNCPGAQIIKAGDDPFSVEILLDGATRTELSHFIQREKIDDTVLAREAISPVPCRFSAKSIGESRRVEILTHLHPLVRWIVSEMKPNDFRQFARARVQQSENLAVVPGSYLVLVHAWSEAGLQSGDTFVYRGTEIGSERDISPEQAEKLIAETLDRGEDWENLSTSVDSTALVDSYFRVKDQLEDGFDTYREELDSRMRDQLDLRLETIEKTSQKRIEHLMEQLRLSRESRDDRKRRMIAANEGRLKKERQNKEDRMAAARRRLAMAETDSREIIAVAVSVYG